MGVETYDFDEDGGGFRPVRLDEMKLKVLVVGSMGCGKSTFVKALCGNHWAEAGISETGVTTETTVCLMKKSVCRKLGLEYGTAALIDCPGTGDPDLPVGAIIAQLEKSFNQTKIHGVFLMNVASDGRVNIAARIATVLLEKSFIDSSDQIVGVMTQCDKEKPSRVITHMNMWRNSLKKSFNTDDVRVVKCAIPVSDDPPYHVYDNPKKLGSDWRQGTPHLEEVYVELRRIAKERKEMSYTEAAPEVVKEIASLIGMKEMVNNQEKLSREVERLQNIREENEKLREELQLNNERMIQRLEMESRKNSDIQARERRRTERHSYLKKAMKKAVKDSGKIYRIHCDECGPVDVLSLPYWSSVGNALIGNVHNAVPDSHKKLREQLQQKQTGWNSYSEMYCGEAADLDYERCTEGCEGVLRVNAWKQGVEFA